MLVDLRNAYTEALAEEAGLTYYGIGHRPLPPVSHRDETRRKFAGNGRDPCQVPLEL